MTNAAPTRLVGDDLRRLMNISVSVRFASQVSLNDVRDLAHFTAVASEMLTELRTAALAADGQGAAINAASLVRWLDDHQPQLIRSTAQRETAS